MSPKTWELSGNLSTETVWIKTHLRGEVGRSTFVAQIGHYGKIQFKKSKHPSCISLDFCLFADSTNQQTKYVAWFFMSTLFILSMYIHLYVPGLQNELTQQLFSLSKDATVYNIKQFKESAEI